MSINPGIVMYSTEWWDIVSKKFNIPASYQNAICGICDSFQLGNQDDALTIFKVLEKTQSEHLRSIEALKKNIETLQNELNNTNSSLMTALEDRLRTLEKLGTITHKL